MTDHERDHQKRLGARGNPIFERTTETTDLEEMRERTEEKTGVCYCGRPVSGPDSLRRCVVCDTLACSSCEIVVRRRIVCQNCAEEVYGLSKQSFLTLHFIDSGRLSAEELIEVTTDRNGTPIEVRVDASVRPLLENGYIAQDDTVTPQGREALQVGRQLYAKDGDVKQALQDARLSEVAGR